MGETLAGVYLGKRGSDITMAGEVSEGAEDVVSEPWGLRLLWRLDCS